MAHTLRDYQEAAISKLRESIRAGHKRPVMAAPTGAGKTAMAAAIVRSAREKGNPCIFTVPALSLIDQTVVAFGKDGIEDVGVVQGDHLMTDWRRPVQVASVQTLARRQTFKDRFKGMPGKPIVIIDECHIVFKSVTDWMAAWPDALFIGLSATPWTKGLGQIYDDLIVVTTTQELIEQGYLSPFEAYGPSHPDLEKVRTVAGDYHEGDLAKAMNQAPLIADTVETWLKRAEQRPTFVFAVDRAHAKNLEAQFNEFSIPTAYIDAFTDIPERNQIRDRFHAGEVKVVCSVGCLTTGVDWDVRCISLCRPTKSEMLFVQMIGRGLRTAPGKDKLLILDHSDTHERLGAVTDIVYYELHDGKPKARGGGSEEEKTKPLPKPCPECSMLRPAGAKGKCPNCGYVAVPICVVETVDGDLVRLDSKALKEGKQMSLFEQEQFYRELKGVAEASGYKPGYAAMKFKDKCGFWPPRDWQAYRADPPSPAVSAWCRAQARIWKSKQKKDDLLYDQKRKEHIRNYYANKPSASNG